MKYWSLSMLFLLGIQVNNKSSFVKTIAIRSNCSVNIPIEITSFNRVETLKVRFSAIIL